MFSGATAMADTITLVDGSTIEGAVKAITNGELEYTTENSSVLRSIALSRVFSVKYDNGQLERFTTSSTSATSAATTPGTSYGNSREEIEQKELEYRNKFGKGNVKVMFGAGVVWHNIPSEDGYKGSDFFGSVFDFRAMYLHSDNNYKGDFGAGLGILHESGQMFDDSDAKFTYLTIPVSATFRSHRWYWGMDLVPGFKISAKLKREEYPYQSMGKCANGFYLSYGLHGGVQFGKFDLGINLAYRFTKLVKNGDTEIADDGLYYTFRGIKGGTGFEFKFHAAYRFKVL